MIFDMKLREEPFEMIKSGKKIYELRLLDEKRKMIKIGDKIIFEKVENPLEKIEVKVVDILKFSSFIDLYANLSPLEIGYTEETMNFANYSDMSKYYSEEEQNRYGVVAIKIEVLSK